ncbi:MAG: phage tail protein [Anaerolineae bacterium]|nr:phage tail protein [Anaerolineae bacterium]
MAQQTDPYRSYNFKLEVGGVTQGHFTECSGLSVNIDPITYREGGSQQIIRHLPGPVDYAAVTLKYGVSDSRELWNWLMKTAAGEVERRNVSVVMMDSQDANETMRWNLFDAWPSEWQGAALGGSDNALAIESLTLVFDSLERA